MKLLLTLLGLFIIQSASTGYLLVSRHGNLRADASTATAIMSQSLTCLD